jgi:hypothetical protein
MRVILKYAGKCPAVFAEKRSYRVKSRPKGADAQESKAALGSLPYSYVFESYGYKPRNVVKKALRKGGGL